MRTLPVLGIVPLLLLTACTGGGSDDSEGSTSADGTIAFDASALSTTPLALPGDDFREEAPEITPVVADPCTVLPAADFDVIVNQIDQEFSLGEIYEFAAEADGASCTYRLETHRVRVTIGQAAELNRDYASEYLRPLGSTGDVSESSFPEAPDVTLLADRLGDLTTEFAAYTSIDGLGVYVANAGGTGLDSSNDGVLWGRVAVAVAARVGDAERLADSGGGGTERERGSDRGPLRGVDRRGDHGVPQ